MILPIDKIRRLKEKAIAGKWHMDNKTDDGMFCVAGDHYIAGGMRRDSALFIVNLPDIAETAIAHAETIRHICQTVHQAHGHEGEPATCRNGVCDNLKTL